MVNVTSSFSADGQKVTRASFYSGGCELNFVETFKNNMELDKHVINENVSHVHDNLQIAPCLNLQLSDIGIWSFISLGCY